MTKRTSKTRAVIPSTEVHYDLRSNIEPALRALLKPINESEVGDTIAVGFSMVLTPDSLLFPDAGMVLYSVNNEGKVESVDVADIIAEDPLSDASQDFMSLHFVLTTDIGLEMGLRDVALQMSPNRMACLNLEFVLLADVMLLKACDLQSSLRSPKKSTPNIADLGNVIRSLWFAPSQVSNRDQILAAKSLQVFLQRYQPIYDAGLGTLRVHMPFQGQNVPCSSQPGASSQTNDENTSSNELVDHLSRFPQKSLGGPLLASTRQRITGSSQSRPKQDKVWKNQASVV